LAQQIDPMAKRRKTTSKPSAPKPPPSRPRGANADTALQGAFSRITDEGFDGYVYDKSDLTRRFVVELLLDGMPLKLTRANSYSHELAQQGVGDGCYGFSFIVPPAVLGTGSAVEARLANDGSPFAAPIALNAPAEPPPWRERGDARWMGGLRFTGWCNADRSEIPNITVMIDGEPAATAQAALWTHLGSGDNVRAVRGFDLHLPDRFADGKVRRVRFINGNGQEITREPVAFVALPDALARMLASMGQIETEQLRGALFDRLVPVSLPLSDYRRWRERFPIKTEARSSAAVAIVLVGDGPVEQSMQSVEVQDYPDWLAAAMPDQTSPTGFDRKLLDGFLNGDASHCKIVFFSLSGVRFSPHSLQRIANAFADFPDADLAYADVDIERSDGTVWPLALPAFDYERMLEQGYGSHLFAVRRTALDAMLKTGATNLYRLFNSALDRYDDDAARRVVHIPGSLGTLPPLRLGPASAELAAASAEHLKARGVAAKVHKGSGSVLPAAYVARAIARGSTTIVIPVRDKPALLRTCLKSIQRAAAAARAEIMIIDNDSSDPEMLDYLDQLDGRSALVIRAPGYFNFSRLNNVAAEKAQSDYLCLMNNDIQAIDDRWLNEMLGRIAEPDVGAVGALLLWPTGVVQHGGVVLGSSFAAMHAFNDRMQSDPGYADALRVAHEGSGVTAACMLTRRRDYLDVGGMDELRFPVNFNDIDYCLKLRAVGKRVIFTPHAKLLHHESASRGTDRAPDRAGRFERELRTLRARWGECLADDPYYNPVLSLDPVPFSGLAWPPRSMAPRTNDTPKPVDTLPGL
jgi:GT2 family glycosyltransferase